MGSRGSVIPFFLSKKGDGSLPITDPDMTRFMITLEQGVELVWTALEEMKGGEIYVKKIPSMKVVDIASTVDPGAKLEIVGIRPGEKIHEQMIGPEDAVNTYDMGSYYMIIPQGELSVRQDMKKLAKKIADVTAIANAAITISLLTKTLATNAEHMKVCMKQAAQWAEEKKWLMK
jgi:FlaA1/EpsC-like NDP-sugar epimerase